MTLSNLRLVETAEIINLPVREPSSFDAAWACRAGQMKKRGDGSEKTRKLWERAAKKVGSARLLEALKAYLREKEPTCGFCGLSVWLNGEKYDHWLPTEAETVLIETPPYHQRAALMEALGEPFVRSYCDPATIHDDGYITPKTGYAKEKLIENARALKACGIVGLRQKE